MGFVHSFTMLATASFAFQVEARHVLSPYKHEAFRLNRRQGGPLVPASSEPSTVAATTPPPPILTYVTPSPGASLIAVTEQSQIVDSFVPQFTLCDLPPQAVYSVTPLPSITTMSTPWRNYSVSIPPGNGTCTTIYSPTQTMICATTLTGLVTKYTVSECAQDITFSTEYGAVLASPTVTVNYTSGASGSALITPAPTLQQLTTYYVAPWEAVTAGTAPEEVTLKVCATYANGTEECIRQYEVWHTSLITQVATTTTSVNISTTIHGLSQLIVETFVANVTAQVTTFSMATNMELEYQTQIETTARETATPTTAPTSYITMILENATPSSSDSTTTRTSTIHVTRSTTVYVGTSTVTLPDGALPTPAAAADDAAVPTPSSSVDWAGLLGIATAKKE
ncbi:hypothetical protein DOTSEDRAFT_75516 [Dothistroma septosporum NZE10]|uniref:Uncharacterized protein n=1 Tax=Dothistroma septosporum (strain NZE10 / CBS 128990) TaxID=675120 RepID=M2YIN8_DOTSN|nr:hypothetical protein DOTSEDRAFT_75516 [Dothistroma septosporum NZE10]